jgi:glycosyltransferase involved in cell wall biosynthesis
MLLGYGHCCINIVKALHREGVHLVYFPMGDPTLTTDDLPFLQELVRNQDSFDCRAASLNIWHPNRLAERIGNGTNCAVTFFEVDEFSDGEKCHLRSVDKLIVASRWAVDVLAREIPDLKPHVVSMGVDREIFAPAGQRPGALSNRTRFLVVGKVELRKGYDVLIKVFNGAFGREDDVELVVSWNNPFLRSGDLQRWTSLYRESPLGDKISFVPYLPTDAALADLMRSCDCMINLTRAEGFGLPLLQALSCGLHLITTEYSAHAEFCTRNNSSLVSIDELEDANDGIFFFGQGRWAKLGDHQVEQAISFMRRIHQLKQEGQLSLNTAGIETAEQLTWMRIARELIGVLD